MSIDANYNFLPPPILTDIEENSPKSVESSGYASTPTIHSAQSEGRSSPIAPPGHSYPPSPKGINQTQVAYVDSVASRALPPSPALFGEYIVDYDHDVTSASTTLSVSPASMVASPPQDTHSESPCPLIPRRTKLKRPPPLENVTLVQPRNLDAASPLLSASPPSVDAESDSDSQAVTAASPAPESAPAPLPPAIPPKEESLTYVDLRQRNNRKLEEYFPDKEDLETAQVASFAIERARADLVLGSSNRTYRMNETNGWILHANAKVSMSEAGQFQKNHWIKSSKDGGAHWKIALRPITYALSLQREDYNRLLALKGAAAEVCSAAISLDDHSANCDGMASLTLYHLLKSGSKKIKRIERVAFSDNVAHTFLVINRAPNSKIEDINSWGKSAFVVDPWVDDDASLRLYPQSKASSCLRDVRIIANYDPYLAALSINGFCRQTNNEAVSLALPPEPEQTPQFSDNAAPLEVAVDINPEDTRGLLPDIHQIEVTTRKPVIGSMITLSYRNQARFMHRQTKVLTPKTKEQFKSVRAEMIASRLEQEAGEEMTPHVAHRRAPRFIPDTSVIDFEDIRIPDFFDI